MSTFTPKAMILAAGRGKRLRPLTDHTPKPMVPLCGKPLIEYHLDKLAAAGITEVVINHAWLGDKIESGLGDGSRWGLTIHYSPEPEGGLETAGGIIQALSLLGEEPFVLVNGDIYTDMPFEPLIAQAEAMQSDAESSAHVMLVPNPEHNPSGDFGLDEQSLVSPKGEWTFAGVSVLHPRLFANQAVGFIPLAPILREAMQNRLVTGSLYDGLWSDIGTEERLFATQQIVCP